MADRREETRIQMTISRKRSLGEEEDTDKKKQKVDRDQRRSHYGLVNQGATCYLNSVLQVLFMTPEFCDRLDRTSQNTDIKLQQTFEKLKGGVTETKNITKSLGINNIFQQRDAAECLEMILHKISRHASEVFRGQLTYTTTCNKDHIINEETNPFWTLPLSLKDAKDTCYSVERGFERVFQTKSYSGENMVYCAKCKMKTNVISECDMVQSPQILTLLLKRFDFNNMSHVKIDCSVDVPRTLQAKNKKYKLYGMVNHMGSLRGGHYTATVLSRANNTGTWFDFDDTHVKQITEQPFAETRIYKSNTAYLLMYREQMEENHPQPVKKNNRIIVIIAVITVLTMTAILLLIIFNV